MLGKFTVGNFLSFKEKIELSLEAKNTKDHSESVFIYKYSGDSSKDKSQTFLKSVAIYGYNASGKSNIINAILFFRNFVNQNFNINPNSEIHVTTFLLDDKSEKQPSFFEVEIYLENKKFIYGFELSKDHIHKEWLFEKAPNKIEIFQRNGQTIKFNRSIENKFPQTKTTTHPKKLLLANLAVFNYQIAEKLIKVIGEIEIVPTGSALNQINNNLFFYTADNLKESSPNRKKLIDLIKEADLGIEDIYIDEKNHNIDSEVVPNHIKNFVTQNKGKLTNLIETKLLTKRNRFNSKGEKIGEIIFNLNQESLGTNQHIRFAGLLTDVLEKGKTLIVDELDSSLHPLLCRFLLKIFNSKNINPNNAQIIFTTHDTSLLHKDFLRKDQIYFTEKNKFGISDLFSLSDIKSNDRRMASYSKKYLEGRYGAIPYIKTLEGIE